MRLLKGNNMKKKSQKSKTSSAVTFPSKLVEPVGDSLQDQLKRLKASRAKVVESDPFKNESRTMDNAALDTEAEEQFGHAMTSAMRKQIDRRIIQTRRALTRIKIGKYGLCEICGNMIDTDRLMVYPEATKCINCEQTKKSKSSK